MQVIDPAVGRTSGDPEEDLGEIGERLDAVELVGFDRRRDDSPVLVAAVAAGEQGILAIEGNRADGSLDNLE
jgi:hypothetical protein